ncbi:MAG: GNAT family N-acetyltransferase [Bacteroidales bacterium]|nr:GNAT family N-acetyltransferase [Bacteroidales bacterium]
MITLRDATPADAPFLASCVMAAMHLHDFEQPMPSALLDLHRRLSNSQLRVDTLYTHAHSRIALANGQVAGSLLSYPGDIYRARRRATFERLWPQLMELEERSEQETDPGEYYLDSLAVLPAFRHGGVARALIADGIARGRGQGYARIALVVDASMPHLVDYYKGLGFGPLDRRRAFDTDFLRMGYTAQ